MAETADVYGGRVRPEPTLVARRRSRPVERDDVMSAVQDRRGAIVREAIQAERERRAATRFALCAEIAVAVCAENGVGDSLASRRPDLQTEQGITRVMSGDEVILAERLMQRLDAVLADEREAQASYTRDLAVGGHLG